MKLSESGETAQFSTEKLGRTSGLRIYVTLGKASTILRVEWLLEAKPRKKSALTYDAVTSISDGYQAKARVGLGLGSNQGSYLKA